MAKESRKDGLRGVTFEWIWVGWGLTVCVRRKLELQNGQNIPGGGSSCDRC